MYIYIIHICIYIIHIYIYILYIYNILYIYYTYIDIYIYIECVCICIYIYTARHEMWTYLGTLSAIWGLEAALDIDMHHLMFFPHFVPQHVKTLSHLPWLDPSSLGSHSAPKQAFEGGKPVVRFDNGKRICDLTKSNWCLEPCGGFHKWGYPKMDGLWWKMPLKWTIRRHPPF